MDAIEKFTHELNIAQTKYPKQRIKKSRIGRIANNI
jgi:hypothetical protein